MAGERGESGDERGQDSRGDDHQPARPEAEHRGDATGDEAPRSDVEIEPRSAPDQRSEKEAGARGFSAFFSEDEAVEKGDGGDPPPVWSQDLEDQENSGG
jgi:hypothetical protein